MQAEEPRQRMRDPGKAESLTIYLRKTGEGPRQGQQHQNKASKPRFVCLLFTVRAKLSQPIVSRQNLCLYLMLLSGRGEYSFSVPTFHYVFQM